MEAAEPYKRTSSQAHAVRCTECHAVGVRRCRGCWTAGWRATCSPQRHQRQCHWAAVTQPKATSGPAEPLGTRRDPKTDPATPSAAPAAQASGASTTDAGQKGFTKPIRAGSLEPIGKAEWVAAVYAAIPSEAPQSTASRTLQSNLPGLVGSDEATILVLCNSCRLTVPLQPIYTSSSFTRFSALSASPHSLSILHIPANAQYLNPVSAAYAAARRCRIFLMSRKRLLPSIASGHAARQTRCS